MKDNIEKLLQQYAKRLQEAQLPIERMFLFGSFARGTPHEWSDIDVGVISKPFGTDLIDEMVKLRQLAHDIDPAISPIPVRPEDLKDRFSVIGDAIRREGKEIAL